MGLGWSTSGQKCLIVPVGGRRAVRLLSAPADGGGIPNMSSKSIGDYAVLSDRHSAALTSRDGSVDWLCFPHFDSPSVFARLLGEQAGHWSLKAAHATSITRRYLDRTMVLETTYTTPIGTAVVIDALAVGKGNRGHALGQNAPHLFLRHATCNHGEVELEMEYAPRPGYGLVVPQLTAVDGGLVATSADEVLVLSGSVPISLHRSSASARFRLAEGAEAGFALDHAPTADPGSIRIRTEDEIAAWLDDTVSAWKSWSELHQAYVGPWRELVHHSGRVLQALSFQPTGAICAAATTSLPETVGGERNWDYRYTWVRDASFTIEALWVAACPDEANVFFDYITASATGSLQKRGDLRDHVRHRWPERSDRAGAVPPPGLAELRPRTGWQCSLAAAPARRLRRTPERGAADVRPVVRPRGPAGRTFGRSREVGQRAEIVEAHAELPGGAG